MTIYHGDCRDFLSSPSLPPYSADLLLTDPPYGIKYVSGRSKHGAIAGDDGAFDVASALRLALGRLRLNHHFYVFGPIDMTGMTVGATCDLVWDEGKFGGGDLSIPWGASWEPVTFGVWNPFPSQRGAGRQIVRRRRGTVLRYPTVNTGKGAREHPTRKPIPLLREFIETSTLMGELVLDPFMGTGSTLEAARIEGRRAIGIEIEERYCEIAAKRCAQDLLGFSGVV